MENTDKSVQKPLVRSSEALNRLAVVVDPEELLELAAAKKAGRLVVLPCKNDIVYTIEEDYFHCDVCEHKEKAQYQPDIQRVSCDLDEHCPLYIKEHVCQGFEISFDEDRKAVLSAPGEWGFEGLETFSGIDSKWYLTREEAEAALKKWYQE